MVEVFVGGGQRREELSWAMVSCGAWRCWATSVYDGRRWAMVMFGCDSHVLQLRPNDVAGRNPGIRLTCGGALGHGRTIQILLWNVASLWTLQATSHVL